MEEKKEILLDTIPQILNNLVAQKLNLDIRSCTFILKNTELVQRIINENPIQLKEFCENIGISRNMIDKYFIETNIISYFKTKEDKGHIYIFANEFWSNYEKAAFTFLDYSQSINWDFELISASIKHILDIAEILSLTTPIRIKILSKIYIEKKSYNEIAISEDITIERVRQIFNKAKQDIFKGINNHSRRINYYKKEINKLHSRIQYLETELGNIQTPKENRNPILNKAIAECDLSIRILTCLDQNDINTIEDLIRLQIKDLFKIRNLGKKSIDEIIKFIAFNNLSFGYKEIN